MEPLISVENVSKKFVEKRSRKRLIENQVLKDINLTLQSGQRISIVGPTGCGKTTLLNLIAGFDTPTSGTITFMGEEIKGPSPQRGVIFQQANVFPWLTVRRNIEFALKYGRSEDGSSLFSGTEDQLHALANALIDSVGLQGAVDQYPYQISGGMKARTALARVLMMGAKVLLLDEPFVALDAQTRTAMHKLLISVLGADKNRAMVVITHDVDEAVLLAERVYIMSRNPGHITDSIEIPFPFPRDYMAIERDALFLKLRYSVLEELEKAVSSSA